MALWFVSAIAMMLKSASQYKTVEIIVSESDWTPPPAKYPDSTLVSLKIGIKETAVQEQSKSGWRSVEQRKETLVCALRLHCRHKLEKFIHIETPQNT